MTSDGTSKDDVKVPEGDLGKQIEADFEAGKDLIVTIVSAMGEEAVSVLPLLCDRTQLLSPGHHRQGVYRQVDVRYSFNCTCCCSVCPLVAKKAVVSWLLTSQYDFESSPYWAV